MNDFTQTNHLPFYDFHALTNRFHLIILFLTTFYMPVHRQGLPNRSLSGSFFYFLSWSYKPISIEMNHVVWIFRYPNFSFPCNVRHMFF